MKEGALDNMWRLDLNDLQKLMEDPFYPCQWELINFKGSGPGRISHHTCGVSGDKMILIGGKINMKIYRDINNMYVGL